MLLDLKNCPFCGGKAEWADGLKGDNTPWRYIACEVCEATAPYPGDEPAAWNRRALQAVGPEPATWEYFCDRSYFDMWCVRQKDAPKVFGDGYHVMSEAEAKSLAAYLNSALVATPPAEPVVEARNYETFRTFAHEATKAITNLTGGGSEYFGKEVDGVFLADLPRCVERLRDRIARAALATKPTVKDDETVVEALLREARDELDNWVSIADRIKALEREVKAMRTKAIENARQRNAAERKIAELEADQKEARGWARSWHQVCQTIATILDLPEPEGETFAQAVSDKWRDYVPADHYASANHARNAAEADKARLSEALRKARTSLENYGDRDGYADEDGHVPENDEGTLARETIKQVDAALTGSGSGWRLVPNGEPVTLDDCPEGLFLFNGNLGFMTEYTTEKNDGFQQRDAYCVDSGEYFWGGASSARERAKLIVQPMLPAAPQQGGE